MAENKPKRKYTVSDKVLAQRKQAALAKSQQSNADDKDYNARMIEHTLMVHQIGQNTNPKDINSLRSAFYSFLTLCQQNGFKPNNIAMSVALHVSPWTLKQWASGATTNPELKEFAAMALSICSMAREQLISDNKINPVIGIFWQRNYDGLRNDTEQIQTPNNQDVHSDDPKSPSDYIKQYGHLLEE